MRMLPAWAFMNGALLVIFYLIDSFIHSREKKTAHLDKPVGRERFAVNGMINVLFLLGVLATVYSYGAIFPKSWGYWRDAAQIVIMAALAWLSMKTTPRGIRAKNEFFYAPLKEVAIIYAAIFACMIPALNILEYKASQGKST